MGATRRLHLTKMSSCKRDLNNETDGDDCLTKYNYFYNPNLLKDKVAFITGGGSGIGFRISELFMRHGCKTAIASRSLERVSAAAKKLTDATKVECLPLAADIRNPEQIETAMDACLNEFGKIDILINSAAGNFLSPIGNLPYNAFKTVMDIDTNGTFNASKAAFDAMTKHMAVEWGSKGIRVNGIAPGPIGGTVGMNKLGGNTKIAQQMKGIIPAGRWGLKTEIGESCLYLASDVSSYTTGHTMVVDGGEWLVMPNDMGMFLKSNM